MRRAMIEDGVAMCEFYAWFEAQLADPSRRTPITELTIDEKLAEARARRPGYVGPSFATIAAFNANGAMPHYRATPESHAIDRRRRPAPDRLGRAVPRRHDRHHPHVADRPHQRGAAARRDDSSCAARWRSAATRFPRGTPAPMLDAIARAPLWEHGLDYGHGTGHGVGYFLNVHEGPQTISRVVAEPAMAMQPGMITSIEPGVYRPGPVGRAGREPRPQRAGARSSAASSASSSSSRR